MDMNKEGQVCIEEWNEMKSKVEDDDVHRFKNKVCESGVSVYIFRCPVWLLLNQMLNIDILQLTQFLLSVSPYQMFTFVTWLQF